MQAGMRGGTAQVEIGDGGAADLVAGVWWGEEGPGSARPGGDGAGDGGGGRNLQGHRLSLCLCSVCENEGEERTRGDPVGGTSWVGDAVAIPS